MIFPELALLAALVAGSGPGDGYLQRTVPIMGTALHLEVRAADRGAALAASEVMIRALEATEDRLSTWREESELSLLNRTPPGQPVRLSPALAEELATVRSCWMETGGAFDPGIGAVLARWDVRGSGRVPGHQELQEALAGASMKSFTTSGSWARRTHPGLILDEGGFGKGAGLDRAAEALATLDSPVRALLDFGGQLAVIGEGASWTAGIAHPRDRGRAVLELYLDSSSAATSGNSERGLEVGGRRYSHLLDPRTGWPAEDFGSLTVVVSEDFGHGRESALWADCLSTGLYVLGPEKALAWAAGRPGVEVLVLEVVEGGGLRARATGGLLPRLASLTAGLEIEAASAGPSDPAPFQPSAGGQPR